MPSTQDLRDWWAPNCNGSAMTTIDFGDQGARVTVDRRTVAVWRAVEAIFAAHHYPIRRVDTGAYNCRRITGGTGWSLHAYGIAVDVNWSTNPYGPTLVTDMPPDAIREIEALNVDGQSVVRWGGRYSTNKDAMHFEVFVPPAALSTFTYSGGLTVADITDLLKAEQDTRKMILSGFKKVLDSEQRTRDRLVDAGLIPVNTGGESELETDLAEIRAAIEAG